MRAICATLTGCEQSALIVKMSKTEFYEWKTEDALFDWLQPFILQHTRDTHNNRKA